MEFVLFLFNPFALRKTKTPYGFGCSECNRVQLDGYNSMIFGHFYKVRQLFLNSCWLVESRILHLFEVIKNEARRIY